MDSGAEVDNITPLSIELGQTHIDTKYQNNSYALTIRIIIAFNTH
jgi:hypothetical protein